VETSSQVRSRMACVFSLPFTVFLPFTSHHQLQACLFFTGEISPKREIKNQKNFENENFFEGFQNRQK
jgi:hypothetical protein